MSKYGIFPTPIHIRQLSVLSQSYCLYTTHLRPDGGSSISTKRWYPPIRLRSVKLAKVVTLLTYFGNARFESRVRHRLFWRKLFVVLLSLSSECRNSTLNLATTASFHILPNYIFTIIELFDIIYSELMTDSLNEIQTNDITINKK
jgi:hypothetical protein